MSSSDLATIEAKLVRAQEHLKLFNDETDAYFRTCQPFFDIKVNPSTRDMFLCLTIEKPLPPRLSVLVGDCVHNARSALDNIICALVRVGEPRSNCKGRQFPAFTNPQDYKNARAKVLKGVPPKAQRVIDVLNPGCPSAPEGPVPRTMHAVAILNTLSNRDKHRAPHLTAAFSRKTTFTADLPEGPWHLTLEGPLYANTEVGIPFPFVEGLIKHRELLRAEGTLLIQFADRSMFGREFGDEPVADLLSFCLEFVQDDVITRLKPFLVG